MGDFPTTWSSVAVEHCEEPVDMEKKKNTKENVSMLIGVKFTLANT